MLTDWWPSILQTQLVSVSYSPGNARCRGGPKMHMPISIIDGKWKINSRPDVRPSTYLPKIVPEYHWCYTSSGGVASCYYTQTDE